MNQKKQLSRKEFLKLSTGAGAGALLGRELLENSGLLKNALAQAEKIQEADYVLNKPENIINSVCLQCNTGCSLKVKLLDGLAVKIDGNPYSPWTMWPHLPYKTSLSESAGIDGHICPKGQSGIQTLYDPYRIRRVLKRAGKRGENKWVSIPFEQAVKEIVEGGKLFSNVPGEENRDLSGLKDIWVLRDPKVFKEMNSDIKEIWHSKEPEEKKEKIREFKEKFKEHLDKLIDPEHPDFGPKNNQLLWIHGRLKSGRSEFFKRFIQDSFGSVNFHGHTTVCQGSLYFTGKSMSDQYDFDEKEKKAKWGGGKKFYWQADLSGAEFVLFVGSSPFEANYGPPYRSNKITQGLVSGKLKYAVVDPRLSKAAAKAWKWLPIKPGTEAALALAMIRWVIENGKYDLKYLANANKAAAKIDKEPNWTNACWLVKIKDEKPGEFLRASDIGIEKARKTKSLKDGTSIDYEFDNFVCYENNQPVAFDPNDAEIPAEGDLLVDAEISGIKVKSVLEIIRQEAFKYTIDGWAELCGLEVKDIIAVSEEFTSHGKRACADIHRGVSQHTNGFYNVLAWYTLNLLIGNYDWQGGSSQASAYDNVGEKEGKPYDMTKLHPKKISPFGISIIRHDVKYEETTIYSGYPAKRPWFPMASDVYQEILPSAGDGYPYPIKALIMYMGTPAYSLPAGQTQAEVLADINKIPLFIASDITIGESSIYADYIIPDLSYLERWEFQGSHPSVIWKVQPVRQPAVAPIPEEVEVFEERMPISLEAFFLKAAELMNLPGFGKGGLKEGLDLFRPEDYYLKMTANVAFGDENDGRNAVPDADAQELEVFLKARRHLPKSVFSIEKWQSAVSPLLWRKVVYVLNRGGRFDDFEAAFDGKQLKNKYGKQINMYIEKLAKAKNSISGKGFPTSATYLPIADSQGNIINDEKEGFSLNLITYREMAQCKSRTISNYWLLSLLPENFILLNSQDALRLGLTNGDLVKVVSKTNPEGVWDLKAAGKKPMIGKLKVIEGIRPGVTAFSLGHGHWAYGAGEIVIDGKNIKPDKRRSLGIHANSAMRIDPYLKNVCLQDLVGASVAFYDTYVTLVKV
ncbi:MAG: molybdopterin oxidoreductase [Omnitrophica WOR_2 bacterium RIFCSPHIGHO2_02_FULL_45_21]|nr:MAG: molybdopterin oxidoreductase [Omnitrophica WOR_2 bacterium RIFCSPHIGHO2_02_FULL_45_21]